MLGENADKVGMVYTVLDALNCAGVAWKCGGRGQRGH